MNLPKLMLTLALGAALLLTAFAAPVRAEPNATLTVKSAVDWFPGSCDSDCTLREAILAANATVGVKETIQFNIPTGSTNCDPNTGVCTIKLLAALPGITDPVVIDGYSQPGASPNTLKVGNNAKLKLVLDGQSNPGDGLVLNAGASTIQGFVVQNFDYANGVGINVTSNNNVVQGNFVGTDYAGENAAANVWGIAVSGAHNLIGGTTPAARNLIAGSNLDGLFISSDENTVQGNYIGATQAGAVPNTGYGIYLHNASGNLIGGTGAGARNVIASNGVDGILISNDSAHNVIQGNWIGIAYDKNGQGNGHYGIHLSGNAGANQFPQFNTIVKNRIKSNGWGGIVVGDSATDYANRNAITRNSIFGNSAGMGIDLARDSETPNDNLDSDDGPNFRQNYPELASAKFADGTLTVKGTLKSAKNESYLVEFFANSGCNQFSDHREGKKYLGSVQVTTGVDGVAKFTFKKSKKLKPGAGITATASGVEGSALLSTSEFSACVAVP